MKTWVRLVLKLLRNKTTLDFSRQLVSPSNCSGHARILRNIFDLSAERLHQLHFLHGISMRHAENNTITASGADQRQSYSCVAGSWLNYCGPVAKDAALFSIENHPQRYSIFYRPPGIEPFEFCINLGKGWWCEP